MLPSEGLKVFRSIAHAEDSVGNDNGVRTSIFGCLRHFRDIAGIGSQFDPKRKSRGFSQQARHRSR